jgi:hypothetical protein
MQVGVQVPWPDRAAGLAAITRTWTDCASEDEYHGYPEDDLRSGFIAKAWLLATSSPSHRHKV